jgi:hypothetical protein
MAHVGARLAVASSANISRPRGSTGLRLEFSLVVRVVMIGCAHTGLSAGFLCGRDISRSPGS